MKFGGKEIRELLTKVRYLLSVKGLSPDDYDHLSRIELEITINLTTPEEDDFIWVDELYSKHTQ